MGETEREREPETEPTEETVTLEDLVSDLEELGLDSGDELVVHSSLSSIGWVDGGAETVVDALLTVVGEEGTIAVPTFTPVVVREEPFDRERTPSGTGAVTEALRARPEALRSDHPTHSVSAIGPAARALTRNHRLERSLGPDSPLHRLAQRGGKVLLIGVGLERNSTLHVAEALAELPYKTGTNRVLRREAGGNEGDETEDANTTVRTVETARVGCGKGFPVLEPVAEAAGALTRGTVGAADARLIAGEDIISTALAVLEDDPGFLLCEKPDCWWCPEARDALSETP